MAVDHARTLRFVSEAEAASPDDALAVVLDSAWTPPAKSGPGSRVTGVRAIGGHLLETHDLISETTERLDPWAAASGIVDKLVVDGTSMWFYLRLSIWVWLQQRILWTAIVDGLVRDVAPTRIVCAPGTDALVVDVARLIAARDGIEIDAPTNMSPSGGDAGSGQPMRSSTTASSASGGVAGRLRRGLGRLRRRLSGGRAIASTATNDITIRRAAIERRLEQLSQEPGRLLVVLEHARQRVETTAGPRDVNPYLSAVVDALRGTVLDPIEIDLKARIGDDLWWERLSEVANERLLPGSVIWRAAEEAADTRMSDVPEGTSPTSAESWVAAVRSITTPLVVHGVDLGPMLVGRIAELAARVMPGKVTAVGNIRALLRRLRPAGVLLADEYHRQDWLTAARLEGVPVAAIQHGMIYRGHNGYIHRDRPSTLALPDRMYVFGSWERELLVTRSVYRPDEVRVSGSPRLDFVEAMPASEIATLRAELGVRPGDRLVVLSGTYGPAYRRFQIPYALDRLLDRPWPGVHLVVKQHPGESDRGPYEALVRGLATARGFAPPPVTIVQQIDLYRLLRAADAHLGIHSTVLTEAVAVGTNNLLADTLASPDLLGYVEAGVAIPVRDGGAFLAALDDPGAITDAARSAFLARHFRAGSASQRLRDELLEWLAP